MKPGGRQIGRRLFNLMTLMSLLAGLAVGAAWFVTSVVCPGAWGIALDHGSAGGERDWECLIVGQGQLYFVCHHVLPTWSERWRAEKTFSHAFEPGTRWIGPNDRISFPVIRTSANGGAIIIRAWLLMLLLAAMPGWWFFDYRRQRCPPGACHRCGYDLRASKEVCPECGEPIPTSDQSTGLGSNDVGRQAEGLKLK